MSWQALARHRLVHNSLFLSLNQVLKFASRGFYILLLARELGPELYGLLSYGHHWYLVFFTLSSMGAAQATWHAMGRRAGDPLPVIRASLALRLLLVLTAWLTCVAAALVIETDERALTIVAILSLAVVARSFAAWGASICVGLELGRPVLLVGTTWRLAEVGAGVWLLSQGHGVIVLAGLHVASYLLEATHLLVVVRRHVGPLAPAFERAPVAALFRMALPAGAGAVAYTWMYQGPVLLLRDLYGLVDELGIVALMMQGLSMAALVPHMANNAFLPRLSRADARQPMRRRVYLRTFIRYGVIGSLLVGLLVTLTDQWVWPWVLGPAYAGLAELTSLIVWALPFLVVGLACQQMLSSLGRFGWYAGVLAPAAVLQTILVVVLAPRLGPAAVAWATLAAFGLWSLLSGLVACRSEAAGRSGPEPGRDA